MNVERKFSAAGPVQRDLQPVVQLPPTGLPGIAIAVAGIIVALLLFLFLDNRRTAPEMRSRNDGDVGTFSAPPPLTLPPIPTPAFAPPQRIVDSPPPPPPQQPVYAGRGTALPIPLRRPVPALPAPFPQPAMAPAPAATGALIPAPATAEASLNAQAVVIDSGVEVGTRDTGTLASDAGSASSESSRNGQAAAGAIRPSPIANPTTVVPAGTLISAVLETPIDSSRPGLVRAIVSKDAKGFDGREVLIPRGSRVIGEFEGDRRSGHNGVLVNWTRLIRPDGVTVDLDSPATDSEGESGIPGQSHGFFLGPFLTSALQSALYVGESLLAPKASTTVLVGLPNGAVTTVAQQSLVAAPSRGPRITVKQGVLVNIFVAHDLDFSRPQPAHR